jgi:hypothetical protein
VWRNARKDGGSLCIQNARLVAFRFEGVYEAEIDVELLEFLCKLVLVVPKKDDIGVHILQYLPGARLGVSSEDDEILIIGAQGLKALFESIFRLLLFEPFDDCILRKYDKKFFAPGFRL